MIEDHVRIPTSRGCKKKEENKKRKQLPNQKIIKSLLQIQIDGSYKTGQMSNQFRAFNVVSVSLWVGQPLNIGSPLSKLPNLFDCKKRIIFYNRRTLLSVL